MKFRWGVLLVSPDHKHFEDTRELLMHSREGEYHLEWASSFDEGQQKLQAKTFDAVLVDYALGEHNGVELIRELANQDYPAPLILLTQQDTPGVDEIAPQSGAVAHLTYAEATPLLLERTIRYGIERKQSEQELKRSEERFSKAFHGSPDAMLISRLSDLIILEVNESFEKSFGYSSEEVVGKTSFEVNLFVNSEERQKSIELLRRQGYLRDFEAKVRTRSGTIRDVSLSIESITIHDNEYILTIADDVTDQKQMEKALRMSEARYRAFFENIKHVVILLKAVRDEQGRVVDWEISDANHAALGLTGLSRQQLLGRPIASVVDKNATMLRMDRFRETLENGTSHSYEATYHNRHYLGSVFGMDDDTIAVTGMDITEQKQAEQALRESEERFRIALAHAPIAVFSQDHELRFTWIYNPILGLSAEEMIGKRVEELWPPDDVKAMSFFLQQVLDSRTSQSTELQFPSEDAWEYAIITAKPTFDEAGAVSGLMGAAMDVSEIRRLQAERVENELRVKAQHLLLEYREKERLLLARMLHDEPLQSLIAAQMELSQVDVAPENPAVENLRTAEELLGKTINNIRILALDLRPPTLIHLGLEKAIHAYIDTFRERNPGIQVLEQLPGEHNALSEDVRLTLYRIFQELMNNVAIHAHASHIRVKMEVKADEVLLEVEDNGKGFEPPRQWIELAYAGHLGLVGIYERLEIVHGHLDLESSPDKGTCVQVKIPIQS